MDESLQQRLRKLGVVKGLSGLKPRTTSDAAPASPAAAERSGRTPEAPARPAMTDGLPGAVMETPHGPFWLSQTTYPAAHAHGRHALAGLREVPETALDLIGVPDLGARPAFLDTETTGLAGGAGTLAFLVGVGVWHDSELELYLIFMRNPDEEHAALHYLTDVLSEATGLVTFNGRGFDVPILEARYILNRLSPVPLALPHLDLLPVARQLWRDHLASRALGELERHILSIHRTGQDIDSGLIPWLYREYLATGDTTEMARVFYHNRIDVLSLASLLVHVARMVTAPETLSLAPAEWAGIGRVYDRAGREAEAVAAWQRALSGELGELDPGCAARLWDEMATRCKRREAWAEALALWDAWIAAVPLAVAPLVEKAKYYEWTAHDLAAALVCTEQALKRAHRLPGGLQRYRVLAELNHRRNRLLRRRERLRDGEDAEPASS